MVEEAALQSRLGQIALFAELDADEIERIAARARPIHLDRGAVLFNVGDSPQGFYLVADGQIKLAFMSPRGGEKVVEILGPGQSFGEAVMFVPRPYPVAAQAMADSTVIFVAGDSVMREIERDPLLARRMIAGLSRRIHGLVGDLEAVSMHSGTQRVIGYLLNDCPDDGSIEVRLPTTKAVLASRLNLTQEHFSRILHELSARGLIEVLGRTIRVPDIDRLRRYVP